MADPTNRYKNCPTLVLDGKSYLGTRKFGDYSRRSDDVYHTIREGDQIDLLALEYLGDDRYWWIIADYNGLAFPLELPDPGTTLRIPSYSYAMLVIAQGAEDV